MSARLTHLAWGTAVAIPLAMGSASGQDVSLSSSFGYASGEYIFAEQYRSMSVLTSLTLRAGRLRVSGSLPVIAQNGTSVSLVAGIPLPTGGPDAGTVGRRQQGQTIPVRPGRYGRGMTRRGGASFALATDSIADSLTVAGTGNYEVNIGDPMFGAALTLFEGTGLMRSMDIEGWAKLPVTDIESGVGTGVADYGIGGSIALALGGTLMFAGATWWIIGDMPDLELRDALFYSVAFGRSLGQDWSALASISASSGVIDNVDPPVSAALSFSRRLSPGVSLHVGAGAGLTESASSFTANVGFSRRWPGS